MPEPVLNPRSVIARPTPAARPADAPKPAAERLATVRVDTLALSNAAPAAPAEPKGKLAQAWDWIKGKAQATWAWLKEHGAPFILGARFGEFKSRQIVWDPSDVNHPSQDEIKTAMKRLATDSAEEARALAALPPARRKQYDDLVKFTDGDTFARRGLQHMLLDGRLVGRPDVKGGPDLLAHLTRLSNQDLAPGLDARALVAHVIAECDNPTRVSQHGKGTCGPTTAQILLIRRNPAEYARLISELASPAGVATLAGGKQIRRQHDWDAANDGNRSDSSRMIQSALMDLGSLPFMNYDNTEDMHKLGPIPVFSGLMGGGLAKVLTQLTGAKYSSTIAWRGNREAVWQDVKDAVKAGRGPVPVALLWGDGGHFVQVDVVAEGRVHYTNPWGQAEVMDETEFFGHLTAAQLPRS